MGEDVEVVQEGKEGGVVEDSKVNLDLILEVIVGILKQSSLSLLFHVMYFNILAFPEALFWILCTSSVFLN